MSDAVKSWWRTRTLREQRLILAAGALLALVLLWLLILRPVGDALSRARERHGVAAQALAEARAQVALIQELQRRQTPALGQPLDLTISQAATEAGFPVSRVTPEGPNVATFVSNSVRPQAFFAWVSQMEATRGLTVDRLTATTNTDQTVTVQVTFRARTP